MRIISLDASTTTIGIAIIDYNDGYVPTLYHHEYYKPNKHAFLEDKNKGLLYLVIEAREYICSLIKKYKVNEFVIEDYVRFMGGKSTSETIIPLAVLNSTLRLGAIERFGLEPNAIVVGRVRSILRKFSEEKGLPKKEDIPKLVGSILSIEFPWYIENKKKREVIMEESYDVADAIAVGLAYIKLKSRNESLLPLSRQKKSSRKKK